MIEKLDKDIIVAMKAHDKETLAVLRMLKAGIKQIVIDQKIELNDEVFITELLKQIKTREESLSIFKEQKRNDLSSKTENEILVLKKYLPEQLSDEEAIDIVKQIINELNATSIKEMGLVMKESTTKLKGRYDMKKISDIVKNNLK